jgi:5-methylcytosine-specific restriction enzyme A
MAENLPPRQWQTRFYKSKEWRSIREIVIKRDMNICQMCESLVLSRVIVHHVDEVTNDNYQDINIILNSENLEVLCFKCHNKVHFFLKKGIKIRRKRQKEFNLDKRDRFAHIKPENPDKYRVL